MSIYRRKPSFDKGRWQVQRERCHLDRKNPDPPFRDAIPIGAVVRSTVERLGIREIGWVVALQEEWKTLVGDAVAAHARPGRVDGKVVMIFVDSSVWLNELKRYGQGLLLQKLRKRFGAERVGSVAFRIDPGQG